MFDARSQIGEIVGSHGGGHLTIAKDTAALQNEIDLFFANVRNGLAISLGFNLDLCEPRYSPRQSALGIARTEDCRVVASCRRQITGSLGQTWNVAMQPRSLHFRVLSKQHRHNRNEYSRHSHSCSTN